MKHLWHPMSETPVVYDENQQSIRLVFRPKDRPYLDVVDFDCDLLDQFQNWEKRFESWCYYDEILTALVDDCGARDFSLRQMEDDPVDGISVDDCGLVKMRRGDEVRPLFCRHKREFCTSDCPEFGRSYHDLPSLQVFACYFQSSCYTVRKKQEETK